MSEKFEGVRNEEGRWGEVKGRNSGRGREGGWVKGGKRKRNKREKIEGKL